MDVPRKELSDEKDKGGKDRDIKKMAKLERKINTITAFKNKLGELEDIEGEVRAYFNFLVENGSKLANEELDI